MELFNVYNRYNLTIAQASGTILKDLNGKEYLDLYGGHGVISIGHSHPHYTKKLQEQLQKIGFYSNSVHIPEQDELASKLGELSGYVNHALFLCNSGAEANENALKLASFHNGKKRVLAFNGSFHGRTSATVNVTTHMKHRAPINKDSFPVDFAELNNENQVEKLLQENDYCTVIVEGIQGVGGLDYPTDDFLRFLRNSCDRYGIVLILDEIQSGYGRSGHFFAHQSAGIEADIVTVAKGMGNGFPISGVIISPKIEAKPGLLGTTFGGNHLACAAGIAVLDVLKSENVLSLVKDLSEKLTEELKTVPHIRSIKGKGLMLGLEFDFPIAEIRSKLLFEKQLFTGDSANPTLLRILPPLTSTLEQLTQLPKGLKELLS